MADTVPRKATIGPGTTKAESIRPCAERRHRAKNKTLARD